MSSSYEEIYEPGVVDPGIPVANPTQSHWLTQPSSIHRVQSSWVDAADVVIIGSGITAASIARTLLSKRPELRVVLVEARDLCSGATGRNGGHIKTMSYAGWMERKTRFGVEEAIRWTSFEHGHLAEMTACIQANNIDCDLRLHEGTDVFYDQASYQQSIDALNDMKQHAPELAAYYTIYTRSEALARFKCAESCVGAIGCPSASLWPYKFVSSLIKKSMDEQNLHVQTNTRVLSVSDRGNDDYAVVNTDRGNIRATPCHPRNQCLARSSSARVEAFHFPCSRKCYPADLPAWPATRKQFLAASPTGEFILGRANTGRRAVGDDSSIDIAPHAHLGGILPLVLKLLPTSLPRKTEITHAWTGILGFTEDGNPFIGSLAEYGRKHQWVCGGYHGIGMIKAFRSDQVLGSMVLGEKIPFEYPASALVDKRRLSRLGGSLRGSRL